MKTKFTVTILIKRKCVFLAILKSFIFFFCTAVFSSSNGNLLSEDVKITIDADKIVTVEEALDMIARQTEYSFVYRPDLLNDLPTLQLKKGTITVRELLNRSLSTTNFDIIINKNDTIYIEEKPTKELSVDQQKSISGKVTDVNDQPLPGVNILVKDTTVGTNTNFEGDFSFEIPEDANVLVFSFVGFKTQEIEVGKQSYFQIQMEEESSELNEVVIVGQRRSNLNAISTKRDNVQIVDAISSDEVGSLPDDNVGDALRRIPGVSQKGDQGETRFVSVRGLNPDYNFFSVNGSRIAVPDRNGRRVFLDVLPSSLSKELQTVKTFTADLDAGGVGAHINLVPRSAFDYKGKYYFKLYGRGGTYENNDGPRDVNPSTKGDMVFAWKPDSANKLGILIAADYYKRVSYTDHLENAQRINFFRTTDNQPLSPVFTADGRKLERDGQIYDFNDDEVYAAPEGVNRFIYLNNRERIGLSAVLDYKLNGRTKFKFMQFYNEGTDDEARHGNRALFDKNRIFGTKTSGFIDFEHRLEIGLFDFTRNVWGSQLTLDQSIGSNGFLSVKGNYSGAKFLNDENVFRFITTDTSSGSGLKSTYHYELANRNALLTPLDMQAYNNLDSRFLRGSFVNYQDLRDLREEVYETQIDYENNIHKNGFGYKIGAKFRNIDRNYNRDQNNWIPVEFNNFVATDFIGPSYDPELIGISNQNSIFILDEDKVIEGLMKTRADASLFTYEERFLRNNDRDYSVTEKIWAAYALFSYKGPKLYINAGLRVENTDFTSTARRQVENNNIQNWEDTTEDGGYTSWLPSVNTHFNIGDDFKIRASYSKSLGRPDFISFAPRGEGLNIPEGTQQDELRGNKGNPDLKPRESHNFDLSLEYYLDKNKGLLSVGLFHKNIKNEFFRLTEPSAPVELNGLVRPVFISSFSNLDQNVKITGFEFNLIKDLDFLPGFLNNLGVSLNALYIFDPKVLVPNTSELDQDDQDKNDQDGDGRNDLFPYTELSGLLEQSNEVYNASIYYQKGKFEGRLAYHYTGDFLDRIDTSNPERNRRQLGRDIVDFKLKYKVNKSLNIFFLSQNLTDSGRRTDYDIPNSPNFAALVKRDFGRTFFLGASYRIRD